MKILVVESDSRSTVKLRDALAEWGYEVIFASGEDNAMEIYQAENPNFVIADFASAKIDGVQLCKKIRECRGGRYPFILLMTKKIEKANLLNGLLAGADDFIGKPWSPSELGARLRAGERIIHLETHLQNRIKKLEDANKLIIRTNEQMKKDLYAVAKIQTSLLPTTLPLVQNMEFSWVYKPCSELAGDGLNVFRLDENHVAFYVLDVSGHGTSAALLSVSLSRTLSPFPAQSSLLKKLTSEIPGYKLSAPAEVLEELNSSFPLDVDTKQFFTIFYGILNLKTLKLVYAIAGHPPPLLARNPYPPRFLEGGGYPIGFVDNAKYEEWNIEIEPGDRLYIFSDGLTEAMTIERDAFGKSGLMSAASKVGHFPLKKSVEEIMAAGENWCKPSGLQDDVSILALEIR